MIQPESEDETKKCMGCINKSPFELIEEQKYRDSKVFWDKISNSRLCPSEPQNINSWMILRIMMLENDDIAADMKRALNLMNITFLIVVGFMCGLIYQFVISSKVPVAGSEEILPT